MSTWRRDYTYYHPVLINNYNSSSSSPDSSSTLSSNGDSVRISSKLSNVPPHPSHGLQLILESLVTSGAQLFIGEESHWSQSVVDGDHHQTWLQQEIRTSAHVSWSNSEPSSMNPEEHRLEVHVRRLCWQFSGVDTQEEAICWPNNLSRFAKECSILKTHSISWRGKVAVDLQYCRRLWKSIKIVPVYQSWSCVEDLSIVLDPLRRDFLWVEERRECLWSWNISHLTLVPCTPECFQEQDLHQYQLWWSNLQERETILPRVLLSTSSWSEIENRTEQLKVLETCFQCLHVVLNLTWKQELSHFLFPQKFIQK